MPMTASIQIQPEAAGQQGGDGQHRVSVGQHVKVGGAQVMSV
jgi:hypothetical protein